MINRRNTVTTEEIHAFQERVLPYLERAQDKQELLRVCEMAIQANQAGQPEE